MKQAVVVGHRGACLVAPENTFSSLEKAIALDVDVVEFDVRPSKDGILYVIHDATVDRTTDGTGRVAELLSSELDVLDAGSWFGPQFVGEPVPRLDAFLDACKGRIKAYVEIKEGDAGEIRDMLATRGMLEDAWTFSFDQSILAAARAHVPDLRRMVLYKHVGSVDRAVAQGAHILEFHSENVAPELVEEAKVAGLVTQMFYDGRDREIFERAIRCGVEQMNIDHIDIFRSVEKDLLAQA
ncbi:glycerophosphodiester phosphodiesterase family protein [Rhodobacterales bacterium]|nr:glycerophosphodiester phosphodiesterase family protein [Rhodobacterales bacterium]